MGPSFVVLAALWFMAAKRKRIDRVLNFKCVSDSSLAGILKVLDDGERSSESLRQSVGRTRKKCFEADTTYGRVLKPIALPMVDSTTPFNWVCPDPFALLNWMCENSAKFEHMLVSTHAHNPSSPIDPWSCIFYDDEATPGAILKLDNKRKTWGLYFSFKELGQELLWHEQN